METFNNYKSNTERIKLYLFNTENGARFDSRSGSCSLRLTDCLGRLIPE
jgi:hypothetical protein